MNLFKIQLQCGMMFYQFRDGVLELKIEELSGMVSVEQLFRKLGHL